MRDAFLPGREAAIRVESGLSGLDIPAPETVTRTRTLLDRLTSTDDVDVVTTANDTFADLVAGRTAIARLDELLESHVGDLRVAQTEARRSPDDFPEALAVEQVELRDLLAAGDLADHAARITAIGHRLADSRKRAAAAAASRLSDALHQLGAGLREQFGGVDDAALAEALRPLEALAPSDDLTTLDAATLDARIDSARARAETAARQLEELRAAGRLAWVNVSEIAPDPIVDENEISPVLERIRQAIADQLGDGKHVRLQ